MKSSMILEVLTFTLFLLITTHLHAEDVTTINATFIEDAAAKGAVCLDGSSGAYYFNRGIGEGVNSLLVYLPGGGWCESKDACVLRSKGAYGSSKNAPPHPFGTILSSNQTVNPDFYYWSKLFILYCDGASFTADVAAVDPETNLHLRGGRILRAAIEEVLAKEFLIPTNAMLVGNSAGGLATMLNCDRVGAFLPVGCKVKCIADSGFFIDGKNLPGAEKREKYFADVIAFHELTNALPASCTLKTSPSLCLFPEYFIEDIQTPLFVLNSDFDTFQISQKLEAPPGNFTSWVNCRNNISTCNANELQYLRGFRTTFLDILHGLAYNRSRGKFISSCYIHDFLYRDNKWSRIPMIKNKTIAMATGDWFFDRDVVDMVDESDTPIDCGDD